MNFSDFLPWSTSPTSSTAKKLVGLSILVVVIGLVASKAGVTKAAAKLVG